MGGGGWSAWERRARPHVLGPSRRHRRPGAAKPQPQLYHPLPPTRYTAWFALQLLTSPRTAFRHVAYHRQTKLQWARDDPAFPLALGGLVCGATAAYCAT